LVLVSGCQADTRPEGWRFGVDVDQGDIGAAIERGDAGGPDVGGADRGAEDDPPAGCGDGRVDRNEVCDGGNLAGKTCRDFGYEGGDLRCNETCTGYLVSECSGIPDWSGREFFAENWRQSDPCETCGPGETCQRGECVSRTCGNGAGPADIDRSYDVSGAEVTVRLEVPSSGEVPDIRKATVHFVNSRLGDRKMVSWSPVESQSFAIRLFRGTYRVWVRIYGEGWPDHVIERQELVVDGDEKIEITVPRPVSLQGQFRIAGGDTTVPGRFEIHSKRPEVAGFQEMLLASVRASEWPQDYDGTGYAGQSYTVRFEPDYDEIIGGRWYSEPRQVVAESFVADEDTSRDFAAELQPVSLSVTVDGEPLTGRHHVELELFQATDGASEESEGVSLEAGTRLASEAFRDGEVTIPLPPGEYGMRVEVTPFHSEDFGAREAIQTVTREFSVPGTDRVAVDFPVERNWVEVGGSISGLPGYGTEDRARSVVFDPAGPEASSFRALSEGEPAEFELQIPAGRYDVSAGPDYVHDQKRFGRQLLREDVRFRDEREPYDLELEARPLETIDRVEMRGRVTVNGRALNEVLQAGPSESESPQWGDLEFNCLAGPCVGIGQEADPLEFDGERYEAHLIPGDYEVVYRAATGISGNCRPPVSDELVGRGYVLEPSLEVEGDQRREFDMKAVPVEGRVAVDGEPVEGENGGQREPVGLFEGVLVTRYRPELDEPPGARCPAWEQAQGIPVETDGEAARFDFLAFPGHFRLRASMGPHRGGVTQAFAVRDRPVELDERLRTTRIRGELEGGGRDAISSEIHREQVEVRTRTSEKTTLEVDDEGRFSGWVVGRDPTIVYERGLENPNPRDGLHGEKLLREGCVDPASLQP
jgi:hypothetical protein